MTGRTAKKVSGPAVWQPAAGTRPPPGFGDPAISEIRAVMDSLALLKPHGIDPAAFVKKLRAAISLRLKLLFLPGGGALNLAADLRQVEAEKLRVSAHNKNHPDDQIAPVNPCGSADRTRELLSMLPGDALRDLDREHRLMQQQIRSLENRIDSHGQAVPEGLVQERVLFQDRIAELTTLIEQRDVLREPLSKLHSEAVRGAIAALCTSLGHLAEQQRKRIRAILFSDAATFRLFPSRIPSTIEQPYAVILQADELCRRLTGRPAQLWRAAFTGLDSELQYALASRLGVRLGYTAPEGGVEEDEPDELTLINREGARA